MVTIRAKAPAVLSFQAATKAVYQNFRDNPKLSGNDTESIRYLADQSNKSSIPAVMAGWTEDQDQHTVI